MALRRVWAHPVVQAAILEGHQVRQKRHPDKSGDRRWFEEMHRLQTMDHAREVVALLDRQFGERNALM